MWGQGPLGGGSGPLIAQNPNWYACLRSCALTYMRVRYFSLWIKLLTNWGLGEVEHTSGNTCTKLAYRTRVHGAPKGVALGAREGTLN